jgi:hypothetical protein
MSKIFYDHIIVLEEVEREIGSLAKSQEEKHELWQIVDEIVHHKVFGCILDNLPKKYHQEFLGKFHETPHDETLLDFLKERVKEDIEELIRQEIGDLASEILQEIRT